MVDCPSLSSVHVLDTYRDAQCYSQCSDVHVVTFVVHWLHFLRRSGKGGDRMVIAYVCSCRCCTNETMRMYNDIVQKPIRKFFQRKTSYLRYLGTQNHNHTASFIQYQRATEAAQNHAQYVEVLRQVSPDSSIPS